MTRRENPRFIAMMDEYVRLRRRDAEEYDPQLVIYLKALGAAIEDEFGQAGLEEGEDWEVS